MSGNKHNLIFIVEDNSLYSLMLDYKLSNESIANCMCFRTGEECLDSLSMDPLLVVLDYELPGMNGKETLKEIKKIRPATPVVILSGNKDKKLIRELFNEGIYDYLQKEPNAVKKLKKIINGLLKVVAIDEERSVSRLRAAFLVILLLSTIIVILFIKNYK